MRSMTSNASFGLNRRMLVDKRSLLVSVTLNTCRIRTCREARLLQLEPAVRIVAIAALHRAFEDLVMKRH